MMQKVNLKRLRHFPKFLVVCVMCGIIFIGGSGSGGGDKKDDSGGGGGDCKATVKAQVTLSFPATAPGRPTGFPCNFVPVVGANPSVDTGATSFSATNQYVCRVSVTGDCPDGSVFSQTTYWVNPSTSLTIEVPANIPYGVIVDYYESCGNCASGGAQGRSQFSFTKNYPTGSAGIITAVLRYISFIGC